MPIPVNCPHCSKMVAAPDGSAGKPVRCPACQQAFLVPAPSVVAMAAKKAPRPSAPPPYEAMRQEPREGAAKEPSRLSTPPRRRTAWLWWAVGGGGFETPRLAREVTIRGRCRGLHKAAVELTDCELVGEEPAREPQLVQKAEEEAKQPIQRPAPAGPAGEEEAKQPMQVPAPAGS